MIDVMNEDLLRLSDVGNRLPPDAHGRRVNEKTVRGWADRGLRLRDGTVVRLESYRIGRRRLTSWQAVRRFIAATSGGAVAQPEPATAAVG